MGAAVMEIKIVNIINFVTAKMSQQAKNNKQHRRFTPVNGSKLDNMLLKWWSVDGLYAAFRYAAMLICMNGVLWMSQLNFALSSLIYA